jgi:hypothetical protein
LQRTATKQSRIMSTQNTTELSSPEILLKELGVIQKDTSHENVCMLYYLLGRRIGSYHKQWNRMPNDADVWMLWFHDDIALGNTFAGKQKVDELFSEATEFAKRCKQARSESRTSAS